jgi:hypothetical protein
MHDHREHVVEHMRLGDRDPEFAARGDRRRNRPLPTGPDGVGADLVGEWHPSDRATARRGRAELE